MKKIKRRNYMKEIFIKLGDLDVQLLTGEYHRFQEEDRINFYLYWLKLYLCI